MLIDVLILVIVGRHSTAAQACLGWGASAWGAIRFLVRRVMSFEPPSLTMGGNQRTVLGLQSPTEKRERPRQRHRERGIVCDVLKTHALIV